MTYRSLLVLGVSACFAIGLVAHAQQQIKHRVGMSQTHFAYANAYQLSRETLAALAIETDSLIPESSGAWVSIFKNQLGTPFQSAPEGGPAFVLNKQGSAHTGAIGVTATNFGKDLILARPAYKHLTLQSTTIRQLEVLSQINYQAKP